MMFTLYVARARTKRTLAIIPISMVGGATWVMDAYPTKQPVTSTYDELIEKAHVRAYVRKHV